MAVTTTKRPSTRWKYTVTVERTDATRRITVRRKSQSAALYTQQLVEYVAGMVAIVKKQRIN